MPRDETDEERADRLWDELLQELRVMQTGVQLTAGFLLTLPLQQSFATLATWQRTVYLVMVGVATLTTALVMTPVAVHVRLSGEHVKLGVVRAGQGIVKVILVLIAVLVVGSGTFAFGLVLGATAAVSVAVLGALVMVGLLGAGPSVVLRRAEARQARQGRSDRSATDGDA